MSSAPEDIETLISAIRASGYLVAKLNTNDPGGKGIQIERGDVIIVDLQGNAGAEKGNSDDGALRPCVVVQNDTGNNFAPTTIVAPVTTMMSTKSYPQVAVLTGSLRWPLSYDSAIDCGHLRVIDQRRRIVAKIGLLSRDAMALIDIALKASLDLI